MSGAVYNIQSHRFQKLDDILHDETVAATMASCMYIFIHQTWIFTKNYTVIMKIIIYSVEISSPIGTISNSEVVNLQ